MINILTLTSADANVVNLPKDIFGKYVVNSSKTVSVHMLV